MFAEFKDGYLSVVEESNPLLWGRLSITSRFCNGLLGVSVDIYSQKTDWRPGAKGYLP